MVGWGGLGWLEEDKIESEWWKLIALNHINHIYCSEDKIESEWW